MHGIVTSLCNFFFCKEMMFKEIISSNGLQVIDDTFGLCYISFSASKSIDSITIWVIAKLEVEIWKSPDTREQDTNILKPYLRNNGLLEFRWSKISGVRLAKVQVALAVCSDLSLSSVPLMCKPTSCKAKNWFFVKSQVRAGFLKKFAQFNRSLFQFGSVERSFMYFLGKTFLSTKCLAVA